MAKYRVYCGGEITIDANNPQEAIDKYLAWLEHHKSGICVDEVKKHGYRRG